MDEIKESVTRDDIDEKIEEIARLTKVRFNSRKTEITVLAIGAALLIATGYWLGKKQKITNSSRRAE